MKNNNRRRGNSWELTTMHMLKEIFPNIVTSRNESRSRDALGVDLCNTGNINFQCKSTINKLAYNRILNNMPDEDNMNIILHRLTTKKGKRFYTEGEYAILDIKDLINLIKMAYNESDQK